MERTKRAASKVTDYRRYHLSGDLNTSLVGKVGEAVSRIEDKMTQSAEEMKQLLQEKEEKSKKLQQDAELMQLQNKLEAEKLKQAEWQATIE